METNDIYLELERLAAAFPWDQVEMWITRQPTGEYKYCAHLPGDTARGVDWEYAHGLTPAGVVDKMIAQAAKRELARAKKIAELKAQIENLQAHLFDLPPYVPSRELATDNTKPANPVIQL